MKKLTDEFNSLEEKIEKKNAEILVLKTTLPPVDLRIVK